MTRWALVAAFSRFGTFSKLKMTSSSSTDAAGPNIPTFSFLRSTYTSPYLVFTPYESLDRDQNPLQTVPADAGALYTKYDGNQQTGVAAAPFNPTGTGIPFLDFGNKVVSSGAPGFLDPVLDALSGGGPASTTRSRCDHRQPSLHQSFDGGGLLAIGSKYLIAFANCHSADICTIDGGKPANVCGSSGVMAALAQIKAAKPVG